MDIIEITAKNVSAYAQDIAKVHMTAYSQEHFTSTFGLNKLTEYNRLLILNSEISLAAVTKGQLVGFIITGKSVSRGVNEFIAKNRIFLIGKMLIRPRFLVEKIYLIVMSRFTSHLPSTATYRLLSVATAPSAQSRGVGALLLTSLEDRLKKRGVVRYGLSVLTKNARAVEFYRRQGFILEKDEMGSAYFRKELPTSVSGE